MHNPGSTAQIVPVYIGERSPARLCGRMVSVDMIFIGTGSVLAYAFNWAFQHAPHGWISLVNLDAWPSILLGLFLLSTQKVLVN
jgi:SP family myo-inositol transporter-like MFS transporter 13